LPSAQRKSPASRRAFDLDVLDLRDMRRSAGLVVTPPCRT
jgi:hypothetical protein